MKLQTLEHLTQSQRNITWPQCLLVRWSITILTFDASGFENEFEDASDEDVRAFPLEILH